MAVSPSSFFNQQRTSPAVAGLWWLTFICSAVLYLLTCQRGVSWQDSGMFQWRVLNNDLTGDLGLALAHPFYIAAARIFTGLPMGSFAFRLNFFSGLGMAIALANLALATALLTGKRWIGFVVAALLALTHTAWWLSTIAEVYSWSVAGLSAELVLLIMLIKNPHWTRVAALALVSGLGLSVHNLALLPLPVYALVTLYLIKKKELPSWSFGTAVLFYLTGAGLYIALLLASMTGSGSPVKALQAALFGRFAAHVFNAGFPPPFFKVNALLGGMNFINVLLPLAVVGWANMKQRLGPATAAALGAITLIEFAFVIRYPVPDQFTFLLPTLFMISLAAGIGIAVLAGTSRRMKAIAVTACVVSLTLQPLWYGLAPVIARVAGPGIQRARELPFRDELSYWLVPWKQNEHSAELFAAAALKQAAPDGIILADSTSIYPLLLVQRLRGLFPSVSIQYNGYPLPGYSANPSAFRDRLGNHILYVVSPFPGYIAPRLIEDADFIRAENEVLYRVRWKH
jgi:hypothetical protein